jgi:hypothetical protein
MLSRIAVSVLSGALVVPAAPAGGAEACAGPLRFAAEAGAEAASITRLDARSLGVRHEPVTDVRLASTRTGLVAQSPVNAAAASRLLGAANQPDSALTRTVTQQAPPDNTKAAGARSAAGSAGPVSVGAGEVTSHARWAAGMACGAVAGEAGTATASFGSLAILPGKDGAGLVRVPQAMSSRSSTAVQRRDGTARTVAVAALAAGQVTLLDGQVTITVVRAPALTASIGAKAGTAEVTYTAPVLEVSGKGFPTQRLDGPGDDVELALAASQMTESAPAGPVGRLLAAAPLPLPGLPAVPAVPTLPDRKPEATDAGDSPVLRISLGELRQRALGQAVAARAVAARIELVTAEKGRDKQGYAGGTVLDLDLGVLEAAAVAPESVGVSGARTHPEGGQAGGQGGQGLPVTGVDLDTAVIGGMVLIGAGVACLVVGLRRRTFRS